MDYSGTLARCPWHFSGLKEEDVKGIFVPGFDVLFAGIVAGLWFFPGGVIARFLAWKPLAYIGAISYGLYLYHMLAQRRTWNWLLTDANTAGWPGWLKSAGHLGLFFVLSFGIAILSYHFLEQPFLRLKDRFRTKTKPQPGA